MLYSNLKYHFTKLSLLALFAMVLLWSSCKKEFLGSFTQNIAPNTYAVADTIARSGDNRFKSIVYVQWWGDDADGYVLGYEISIDGANWAFTNKQDSTFSLAIPNNADTFDFAFYIRAIDNKGLADPEPVKVIYPVKNSAPEVRFVISARNPDRSFPAVKFFWEGTDPDGNQSIDRYELAWNDTNNSPFVVNAVINEALFVANNLNTSISDCKVLLGSNANPASQNIPGMLINDSNQLFIRAVDKVGASSAWKQTPKVFIRKPLSDFLFINAQQSTTNCTNNQNSYMTSIRKAINTTFDTLQAGPSNAKTDLSVDPITQDYVFTLFKKIFVYGESAEALMTFMQRSSQNFFSKGGKMFVITETNDNLPTQPSFLDFSPAASFTPLPSKVSLLYNLNDTLFGSKPNVPYIVNSNRIHTGIRPLELLSNNSNFTYEVLNRGVITQDSSGNISKWLGNNALVVKRNRLSDNKTDFILACLPIVLFRQDINMDNWFKYMMVNELEF